jgi:cellobiose-specific phosphotransferase system component IIA
VKAAPAPPKGVESAARDRLWRVADAKRVPPAVAPADRAALYKELPRLVNDVKPLLLLAKKVGVEIGQEKELISEAIAHGKKRDVERAVRLIRDAQFRLEGEFTSVLAKRIESVLVEADRSRQTGGDISEVIVLSNASIDALERKDYAACAEKIKEAKQEFDARSGGYGKARQEYELSKSLVIDAKKLGLDLREANTDLRRSESALQSRNWEQATILAIQARQALFKALPGLLNQEMKKARDALLEMKVRGGDLAKPVGILKQASIHLKREEFADALRFVAMFRDQVGIH